MGSFKNNQMPDGFDHQAFLSIDSTNKEAMRRIEAGAHSGMWITSGEQTGGRGRGGREWVSSSGNLYSSLIYDCGKDLYTSAQLTFVTTLAVRETIEKFLKINDIKCKWPNDVLVEGKKISGILLESFSVGVGKPNYIVIGIGINVAHHPELALYESTHINAHSQNTFSHIEVFYILARKMAQWINIWQSDGFAVIRENWLQNSKGLGDKITVRTPESEIVGRFVDLDRDGALMLEVDNEIKLIHSGDVFFTKEERVNATSD